MGTTVTGGISAALSSNFSKDLDIGAVSATPSGSVTLDFLNGTGAGKIEAVLIKAGTIAGSGSVDIDLAAAIKDPGGDLVTLDKVKGILIKNVSAVGVGSGFEIGGTFASYMKAAGDEIEIHPGGFFCIGDPGAVGYAVTADATDTMTLSNLDATAQDYEAYFLGEIA